MSFQLITPAVVEQLLSVTAEDSEPLSIDQAAWYADVSNDLLAAIMPSRHDVNWRYAIFERDRAGNFRKVKDGEDLLSEIDARVRMNESAQQFLAGDSNVRE